MKTCSSLVRMSSYLFAALTLNFGTAWFASVHAETRTIYVAQIVPQSGPLASVGNEISAISQATIDDFNNEQTKYKLILNVLDDGNQPEKSAELAGAVAKNTDAFLSCFGTTGCLAQQKVANAKLIPLIGPIAGANGLRGTGSGQSFAVRASASDEIKTLLKFCSTTQMDHIGVLVQDDGFGRSYALELDKLQTQFPKITFNKVLLKPQAADYKAAITELQKINPHALLLLANVVHSSNFLMTWKEQQPLPFVLNLAGQANALFASKLKGYTGAAAFVTVTPSPWESRTHVQREYQRIAKSTSQPLSYLGFEAFLNARLLIKSIQSSGAKNASDIANYLESANPQDLGGYIVSYSKTKLGSSFSDLALLRRDGNYKH